MPVTLHPQHPALLAKIDIIVETSKLLLVKFQLVVLFCKILQKILNTSLSEAETRINTGFATSEVFAEHLTLHLTKHLIVFNIYRI